ncbi:efflux RND transporter periplasmic adaptor subunit [Limibaculum sp. M0105]|uniref:Efflux RND transporter periplasmic adaptor subunit n=1 Tax=Thermohalobaculum xanthum TaxID=2753746 RepID=A0A8J7SA46_9RHOB|nr:efflux RND transporter periplasmic adaptor subunit [Thermohalobaculum xanthum]MBK0398102.1 efflux RND transporter periplasmic adaptor subunit [Thermohalobaculum xanthum]
MTRIEPIEIPTQPAGTRIPLAPRVSLWRRILAAVLKTVVPLVLLAAAGWVAYQIIDTAPVADRRDRPRLARLVEVVEAAPAAEGPMLDVWGDVAAPRVLNLRPEVSGLVIDLNPDLITGGEVAAGELLVGIDDRTARQAVAGAEAAIRQIDARIAIERGQGARAALDLGRLPGRASLTDEQRALILREPQMAELRAEREAAEAALERAALDLARTRITAPFDALVDSADVAQGSYLTAGTEIATLVPVDRFEVRLAVPLSALAWLDLAEGAEVRFTQPGVWPEGAFRTGRVLRVSPRLNPAARMAEVIAEVGDPMARTPENEGKPPLLLGSFLRASMQARAVPGAVTLPRAAVRDGDTVWVMTPDDRLDIRPVVIAWRGAREVLISDGLAPGERVVTTVLASVSNGMALRLPASEAPSTADASRSGGTTR